MHTPEELNELLELCNQNKVDAWIKTSARSGHVLCVLFEYPLKDVQDLKGLQVRLQNFKELGTEGL